MTPTLVDGKMQFSFAGETWRAFRTTRAGREALVLEDAAGAEVGAAPLDAPWEGLSKDQLNGIAKGALIYDGYPVPVMVPYELRPCFVAPGVTVTWTFTADCPTYYIPDQQLVELAAPDVAIESRAYPEDGLLLLAGESTTWSVTARADGEGLWIQIKTWWLRMDAGVVAQFAAWCRSYLPEVTS